MSIYPQSLIVDAPTERSEHIPVQCNKLTRMLMVQLWDSVAATVTSCK